MAAKKRAPKISASLPPIQLLPRAARNLGQETGLMHPLFSLELVDRRASAWSWSNLTEAHAKTILDLMMDLSGSTWNEIWRQNAGGRRRHHHQAISSLDSEAQRLLSDGRYEQYGGDLFRFRLSGEERLWGYQISGIFFAVWWDPDHKVYPTTAP